MKISMRRLNALSAYLVAAGLLLASGSALAQEGQGSRGQAPGADANFQSGPLAQNGRNATARVTGSVTGTVFFADTQRPARFVNIQLIPVGSLSGGSFRGGGGSGAQTALDGTFLMDNVEVGDYYLSAFATGYLSPVTLVQAQIGGGANADDVLRQLTIVHVAQGVPSSTSLTLARGAVLSGTASWDDGSPAAGVQISAAPGTALPSNLRGSFQGFAGGRPFGGGGGGGMTDDRGHFRVMGLAPGEYTVRATVQAPVSATGSFGRGGSNRSASLSVYAPDKLRRSEADVIKLGSAEEHDGVAVTLNLHALHTVSGRVSSASGGAVTGGQVRLVDSTDNSLSRFAEIGSDGSFSVPYVPAGTYTMTVNARTGGTGANQNGGPGGSFNPGQSLQPLQQTLAVTDGDVSGLTFTAAPAIAASR